jgi:hypothetical protein
MKIKILLIICAFLFCCSSTALCQGMGEINIEWDANKEADVKGYHVKVDGDPVGVDVGNVTEYKITGLNTDQEYVIAIDCHDTSDNESIDSESIKATAKNVATPVQPTGLKEK